MYYLFIRDGIAYINIYSFCSSPSVAAAAFLDAFSAASAARISSNFSDFDNIISIFGFCLDLQKNLVTLVNENSIQRCPEYGTDAVQGREMKGCSSQPT